MTVILLKSMTLVPIEIMVVLYYIKVVEEISKYCLYSLVFKIMVIKRPITASHYLMC